MNYRASKIGLKTSHYDDSERQSPLEHAEAAKEKARKTRRKKEEGTDGIVATDERNIQDRFEEAGEMFRDD